MVRMGITGTIVFMYGAPLTQCLVIIGILLVNCVYYIVLKPQSSVFEKIVSPLDILCIISVVCIFIKIYYEKNITNERLQSFGWLIFGIILATVFKTIVFIIIMTVRPFLKKLGVWKQRLKDRIDGKTGPKSRPRKQITVNSLYGGPDTRRTLLSARKGSSPLHKEEVKTPTEGVS